MRPNISMRFKVRGFDGIFFCFITFMLQHNIAAAGVEKAGGDVSA
jgi:hypothetical protein